MLKKRIFSMTLVVVMLFGVFGTLGVSATKNGFITKDVVTTLFDSDAITPFEKTTGTAYGNTYDSYGSTNISGTTTTLAEDVRIASGWGNKGASAEMIDEGDRTNIIKTAEDGADRTTLSFGPTYDNAPAIKDGDVLELSFDYKFVLNANYTDPNFNSALIFDTPYRSKMFGSWGAGSLGNAWVNANSSSGLPQTVTGWGKVSTANGTRYFGPSNNLSYGVGLMDAGKWYNVKITITDPADGSDQKITWTYTALDDGDVIETKNDATNPAQKSYTITKTLDMDGTTDGVQPLEKATAFGFTFEPKVDEYYDNIKYTITTQIREATILPDVESATVIDLDFDTLDASKFVTKTGSNYTSGAIEAGDVGSLKYQNIWVETGNWSATTVDDGNGGKALKVNDKSGHTSNVRFLPESNVAISKGDVIDISFDFTYTDAIRSYFTLMGYENISLFKIDGEDMWQWKNGAHAGNSIGGFSNKNGKGFQFNMPHLNGMGNETGYLLVSGTKYNVDITINTNDPECPDTVWGNTIDNKQTIKFVVTDKATGNVLTWSKAVLDANTSDAEQVGVSNNQLAQGKLESADLITTFTGLRFGQSYEGVASNYVMDDLKVVVTKPGVDAYGEGIVGLGDDLEFIPGKEISVIALATGKPGDNTNFIIAQYDNKGILINTKIFDLSEFDYTKTDKFTPLSNTETIKLFVLDGGLKSNVETLTIVKGSAE